MKPKSFLILSCLMALVLFAFAGLSEAHYRVNSSNSFLVLSNSQNLDMERALAVGLGLTLTDGGAGGSATLNFAYTATLAGNPALLANQCIWALNGWICEGSVADGNEIKFTITNPTADREVTWPDAGGSILTDSIAFAGDVTGTSGATVVGDDSHEHTDATVGDLALAGDVTGNTGASVVADDSHDHTDATVGDLALAGDVTGNTGASVVADDSHNHTGASISGLSISTATDSRLTPAAAPPVTCDAAAEGMLYYDTSGAVCVCALVGASLGWNKILGDGTCA